MPVMDGYQASDAIRKVEKEQLSINEKLSYIIGLTAHSTDTYKKQCFDSGMNEFMTKPV